MRHRIVIPLLAVFLVAAGAAGAHAGGPPWPDLRLNLGPEMAILEAGDMSLFSFGMHGSLEKQLGEYYVSAELDRAVGSHGEIGRPRLRAVTTRLGAGLRFPLWQFGRGNSAGALWGYTGVGMQRIRVDRGGLERRVDVALGLSTSLAVRPKSGRGVMKYHGFRYGIRMLLASAPDYGPLSSPGSTDFSMMLDLSLSLGR